MNASQNFRRFTGFFVIALVLFGVGLIIPGVYLDTVTSLGHFIPQTDMASDYVSAFFWASILWFSILLWPVSLADKKQLLIGWLVKILVTLGAMLFYENKYGLDAYEYFRHSSQKEFALSKFVFGNGTENITNLARLHHMFLPDSYHAMKVSFAMVGFIAVYLFYRAAVAFLQREDIRVLYLFLYFPSILFWSSILGKDPIVLLGIALYVYGVVGFYRHQRTHYLLILLSGVLLAMFIRIWLGAILLAPLTVFVISGLKGTATKIIFIVLMSAAFLFSVNSFKETFNVETSQDIVATTGTISTSWAKGGSANKMAGSGITSIAKMIAFIPIGSFTALFRPLPGEVLNIFGLLAGLENLMLLILLWKAFKRSGKDDLKEPLIRWAILLILTWSILYGYVSYQNMGSAARFKLQILPVLLGTLVYLARKERGGGAPIVRNSRFY